MIEAQVEKWLSSHLPDGLPLAVVLPSGRRIASADAAAAPKVEMRLTSPLALRHLIKPSLSSLGSAYVEGLIDVEGKVDDIVRMAVDLSRDSGAEFEDDEPGLLARLLAHSKRRDRAAIEYHYDVSNDFYRLFLDERMVYSCAYFRHETDTLDQAQENKLDHILNKLRVQPGERFLDVGSGWGALIVRAAQRGAIATGVTLSTQQYEHCQELIARLGLADRCSVRLLDYRDIPATEQYEKIASVGMFEHVGHRNLSAYFEKMQSLLAPGGAMLMHGITSTMPGRKQVGRGGGDFIDRYVFPDGELPHLSFVLEAMAGAGLEVVDVESLRRHYAATLAEWARRFEAQADKARELAGDKRFRIWRVYLAGCSYGFAHNWMNIYQILACRLGSGNNPFPMTREWMYRE